MNSKIGLSDEIISLIADITTILLILLLGLISLLINLLLLDKAGVIIL